MHPPIKSPTLIMTAASAYRCNVTFYKLMKHISSRSADARSKTTISHYTVDFSNLASVSKMARVLAREYTRIDYVFLNADTIEFKGTDWTKFAKSLFKCWDWVAHGTYLTFKTQTIGCTSTQYTPGGEE